jgi:hypothetical protein
LLQNSIRPISYEASSLEASFETVPVVFAAAQAGWEYMSLFAAKTTLMDPSNLSTAGAVVNIIRTRTPGSFEP